MEILEKREVHLTESQDLVAAVMQEATNYTTEGGAIGQVADNLNKLAAATSKALQVVNVRSDEFTEELTDLEIAEAAVVSEAKDYKERLINYLRVLIRERLDSFPLI
jgi:septation ring formation regulator EzrA